MIDAVSGIIFNMANDAKCKIIIPSYRMWYFNSWIMFEITISILYHMCNVHIRIIHYIEFENVSHVIKTA